MTYDLSRHLKSGYYHVTFIKKRKHANCRKLNLDFFSEAITFMRERKFFTSSILDS